jgi:Domain of unknown function (DUF4148)
VSAQEKTRAEVRQELIEAENNGLRYVTETSYPTVAPTLEGHVAHREELPASDMGAEATNRSQSGKGAFASRNPESISCTGPNSFCNVYFGG